jgi:hypothetical protein
MKRDVLKFAKVKLRDREFFGELFAPQQTQHGAGIVIWLVL